MQVQLQQFTPSQHLYDSHEPEILGRIGPFKFYFPFSSS